MDVQTESIYVVRMSRFEAAKALIDPKELQARLRERLDSAGVGPEMIIEGATITRALPAPANSGNGSSDRVKKIMRGYRKSVRRVKCARCDKMVKPGRGMSMHLVRSHGVHGASAEVAA